MQISSSIKDFRKYKIKLSVIFTVIIIFVIFLFQGIYSLIAYYKAFDVSSRMLSQNVERIERNIFRDMDDVLLKRRGLIDVMDPGPMGNMMMLNPPSGGFRNVNLYIVLDKGNNIVRTNTDILDQTGFSINYDKFSSLHDDEMSDIKIYDQNYLILKKTIQYMGDEYVLYSLIPNLFPFSRMLSDMLIFLFFLFVLGVLLYYLIYKLIDQNLRTVEQNISDMENFINDAGHELKTPLAIASSSIQLANISKSDKKKEYLDQAKQSIDKMDNLISSLIDLSNIDMNYETEDINLQDIIDEIKDYHDKKLKEKEIDFENKVSEKININANKEHLFMLISNLVNNAIKYNKVGGKITLSYAKNILSIKDTGVGIDRENLDKIFERFFQVGGKTNQEGFGIGLSLVKKICNIYGWQIGVSSEKGKGTNMKISFR